jgi:multicomponent Na+:H+ antiporter subunit A
MVPVSLLLGLALLSGDAGALFNPGPLGRSELPQAAALGIVLIAIVTVVLARNHLAQILALSCAEYALATVYAFRGAPDLALVAVVVATLSTLFLVALVALFPHRVLDRQEREPRGKRRGLQEVAVGVLVGGFSFAVVWASLSWKEGDVKLARTYMELAPTAHAGDAVTAILSDFRGLDTMAEVSVLIIALLGIGALMRARRQR